MRYRDRGPMFIALRREHFDAFRDGRKRIEYRRYGARWNTDSAHEGRAVVLSMGYGRGARLTGRIVFSVKLHRSLAPAAARQIYADAAHLCAIHVVLDKDGIPRK